MDQKNVSTVCVYGYLCMCVHISVYVCVCALSHTHIVCTDVKFNGSESQNKARIELHMGILNISI